MRNLFALALVVAVLVGCQPKPGAGPGTTVGSVISCGTKAVAEHGPEVLPAVNQCLAGAGDVTACLIGLIQPALGITVDTVACLVRHEGSAARAAAESNAGDVADAHRAARAREFLEKERLTFTD